MTAASLLPAKRQRPAARLVALGVALTYVGAAGAIDVVVDRLDGSTLRGRLAAVSPCVIVEAGEGATELAWSDLLSLRAEGPPASSAPATATATAGPLEFRLADQSVFFGRVSAVEGDEFIIALPDAQSGRVTLPMLASIEARGADGVLRSRVAELRRASAESDAAVVARGAEALTLRGVVKRVTAEGVDFDWNGREVRLPWANVVGIVLARPAARSSTAIVRLRDGAAFAGRVVEGDDQAVVVQSAAFDRLRLAWTQIERIDVRSQRVVFLSEIEPARYDFEPFFDKHWDYARDRTLSGQPIRLGGREFARGLTLHSRAALAYRIAGEFDTFVATVGICDEMGTRGAALARVLADDQVVWEAPVRGGAAAVDVRVPLRGVSELILQVDYDVQLDIGDHVCWGLARLIR